jgi:dTDP-4-amino-4,6-dideoxygalactose transaminase
MKKSRRKPFSKPAFSESDIQSAVEVLRAGRLLGGLAVETFEKQLQSFMGGGYAVCVSSGTAALHLGLLSLGIRPGDDLIVPAFGYPSSANVVEVVGARPVFVDSESNGFNIDVSRIENHITSRTRAIIVVHNFGYPVDISRVQALSAKYDIPIIEDASCALGAGIHGSACGDLGRLAVFSFHAGRILTTGEGGTVVTNDIEIAEKVRKLGNHGPNYDKEAGFFIPGLNYRLTEFQAALGISQMNRLDGILKGRLRAAEYYLENLQDLDFLMTFPADDDRRPNYQTFVVSVPADSRDEIIRHLKHQGIETGIGACSIPHSNYYAEKYKLDNSRFPHSLRAFRSLLALPLHEDISREEQDLVVDSLRLFGKTGKDLPTAQAVRSA